MLKISLESSGLAAMVAPSSGKRLRKSLDTSSQNLVIRYILDVLN